MPTFCLGKPQRAFSQTERRHSHLATSVKVIVIVFGTKCYVTYALMTIMHDKLLLSFLFFSFFCTTTCEEITYLHHNFYLHQ